MKCPVCPDSTLTMTHRENIEIDYCPQCRGVWLDRGELDKLIERAAPPPVRQNEPPPSHMHYDDDRYDDRHRYRDQSGYKKHKRRGLLGEIFDFD